ncbi:beta-ketoacyl synthase N-terminal-like domain-containing protein [Streptomyces thermoviolaceus]|uniref:beta-ketoacyl synthase N-terminal-like domain-containing protein n=1 Tax=Streptomyces thermoviolaceus TaxID=1952 RepID=UPI0033B3036B
MTDAAVTDTVTTDTAPATHRTASTAVIITGYGVLSPAGIGGKVLGEALRTGTLPSGESGTTEPGGAPPGEALPPLRRLPVPDVDPREHLGHKGLSSLSRTAVLGMTACELALRSLPEPVPEEQRSTTGVVLGTSTGSARAIGEFFRDTYEQERPYLVSPALFPGILLNHAAGQVAMRHGFTGVNASLAGGRISGLSALRYARNAVLTGQAGRVLAGSMEELSPQGAWAWHRAGLPAGHPVGEGGAVFVLERGTTAAHRTVAELHACETRFAPPEDGPAAVAEALARCVTDALAAGGVTPDQVEVVSAGATALRGWSAVEARGRGRALDGCRPVVLRAQDVLGETHSAGAALQLAALLGFWEQEAVPGRARWGLVTAVGADGSVAAALLRRPPAVS